MRPLLAASAWGGLAIYLAIIGAVAVVALAGPAAASSLAVLGLALLASGTVGAAAALARRHLPGLQMLALAAAGLGLWRAATVTEQSAQPWAEAPTRAVGAVVLVEGPPMPVGAWTMVDARIESLYAPPDLAPPAGRVQLRLPAASPAE